MPGSTPSVPAEVSTSFHSLVAGNAAQLSSVWFAPSTMRAASSALPGTEAVRPDEAVWVAVAQGHFVGHSAKRPRGAPPPEGTVLWSILTEDGDVSAWGICNDAPRREDLERH